MQSVTYIGLAHNILWKKNKKTFGPTQYYMLEGEKCYEKKNTTNQNRGEKWSLLKYSDQGNWGKRFAIHELNKHNDHRDYLWIEVYIHAPSITKPSFLESSNLFCIPVVHCLYLMALTSRSYDTMHVHMYVCMYACSWVCQSACLFESFTQAACQQKETQVLLSHRIQYDPAQKSSFLTWAVAGLQGSEDFGKIGSALLLKGYRPSCWYAFLWLSLGSQNATLKWFGGH